MRASSNQKITRLLGIPIKHLAKKDAAHWLEILLSKQTFHHIVTANPEILLTAHRNETYRTALRQAEACVPDGFGILVMSAFVRPRIRERITGGFLTRELLRIAETRRYAVAVLLPPTAMTPQKKLEHFLKNRHPHLTASITQNPDDPALKTTDIIVCALGHPDQELWIAGTRNKTTARIAVGVGGAFDVMTGSLPEAPFGMRRLGLEWLWRLLLEPKRRGKRIINAIIIFPILTIYVAITRTSKTVF